MTEHQQSITRRDFIRGTACATLALGMGIGVEGQEQKIESCKECGQYIGVGKMCRRKPEEGYVHADSEDQGDQDNAVGPFKPQLDGNGLGVNFPVLFYVGPVSRYILTSHLPEEDPEKQDHHKGRRWGGVQSKDSSHSP